jgi:hypothetical protein
LVPRRGFVRGEMLSAHSHYGTSFVGRAPLGCPPRFKPRECVSELKSRKGRSPGKNGTMFFLGGPSWLLYQCRLAALFSPIRGSGETDGTVIAGHRCPQQLPPSVCWRMERVSCPAGWFLETSTGARPIPIVCPAMCSAPAVSRKWSAKKSFVRGYPTNSFKSCRSGGRRLHRRSFQDQPPPRSRALRISLRKARPF